MYKIRVFFRNLLNRKPSPSTDDERSDQFLGGHLF